MTNTTATTKMTKIAALTFVMENYKDMPEDVATKIQSMIDYENSRKTKTSGKQAEKKAANDEMMGKILELFVQNPELAIRASELPKMSDEFAEFSTSRASYLLNALVQAGQLVKDFVKRNTVFKLA